MTTGKKKALIGKNGQKVPKVPDEDAKEMDSDLRSPSVETTYQ